jgi:hypothetical protein
VTSPEGAPAFRDVVRGLVSGRPFRAQAINRKPRVNPG